MREKNRSGGRKGRRSQEEKHRDGAEVRKERRSWPILYLRGGRISRYRKTASNQRFTLRIEVNFRLYEVGRAPSSIVEEEKEKKKEEEEENDVAGRARGDVAIISAHGGRNKRLHAALVNIYLGRYLPSRV